MLNLLLRDKSIQANGKISNTYGYKRNKKILNKINSSLPELMSRNLRLGERLKNKITVSSFMNNAENKNQKYLKYFVISSGKRVKDLKTGLDLKNVIKKGINHLSPICNHINNDLIIKNGDFLIKQKKLINEKTEQETHNKINELIKGIRHIIKPIKIMKKPSMHKIVKSVSEEELHKAKELINHEIYNDQRRIRNKIDYYISKVNTVAETRPREFHKLANNIYFKSSLKMINYSKPKLSLIKDLETSTLIGIRKHLIQSITKNNQKNNIKKEEKEKENDYVYEEKLKNSTNFPSKKQGASLYDYSNDTLTVVKNLANQNELLAKKAKKNLRKINSLIDIKLPFFSNYSRTIKYCKKGQNIKSNNMSMDNFYNDNSDSINKMIEIGFHKDNMAEEIKLIKKEINNITDAKIYQGVRNIEELKNQISEKNN
jgi:hypothetical protein